MADDLPLMVQAREIALCIRSAPFGSDVDLIHDALRAAVAAEKERAAAKLDQMAALAIELFTDKIGGPMPDNVTKRAEVLIEAAAAIRGDTKP